MIAAYDASSYAFQIGYKNSNDGMMNIFFYIVKKVLSGTVSRGTLDDMFKLNLGKWTKTYKVTDAFTTREVTSFQFLPPSTEFIYSKIE